MPPKAKTVCVTKCERQQPSNEHGQQRACSCIRGIDRMPLPDCGLCVRSHPSNVITSCSSLHRFMITDALDSDT